MEIPPYLQPLVEGMKRAYAHEDFTDLEIVCNDRVWKVHKVYLCAQSSFFEKACSGPFWEASESRIDLSGENDQAVDAFIYYFYHFDYANCIPTGFSPMLLDVRLYVIADKYFVPPLKKLATEKFQEAVKTWWNTRAFAEAITEVYETTLAGKTNPLKQAIKKTVVVHAQELLCPSDGETPVLGVMEEIAEFGRDISMALAQNASQGRRNGKRTAA